jgi:hypothetical protein
MFLTSDFPDAAVATRAVLAVLAAMRTHASVHVQRNGCKALQEMNTDRCDFTRTLKSLPQS